MNSIEEDVEVEMENIDAPPSFSVGQSAGSQTSKRKTSMVWDSFTIITDKDGKQRAKCNKCPASYAYGSATHGTRNLRTHMTKCPGIDTHSLAQQFIAFDGKLQKRKVDPALFRERVAEAIIMHNYPYSIVEHRGFRRIIECFSPEMVIPSRNTIKEDVLKIYRREKANIKNVLEALPSRICLTTDIWTSGSSEGYMSLTVHYVDDDWILNSKILSLSHIPPPHTGSLMCDKMMCLLKEWGIDKKIFSLTMDNATNNDKMEEILKRQLCLENSLVCNGAFFHIRCCAHILNLIVQEGLKTIDDALFKIRESVKYVKVSERRKIKFVEIARDYA